MIQWTEAGQERSAAWRSALGAPPPRRVVVADDRMTAATAYRLACEGTALLWRGDFQGARQLLAAMGRRCKPAEPGSGFHRYRQAQSQRARTLGMLLVPYAEGHVVPLRRAPDVREACAEVFGPEAPPAVGPLRELLGLIGAHEWRRKGCTSRRWTRASIRITGCSRRSGASTSIWWRGRRCPATGWRSTSAPARACWRRCWPGAGCGTSWRPTSTRGPWSARGRTSIGWACPGGWRW
ncbi:hypothetical protein ACFQQB_07930 [Nonomuraea rubra]|uniref:hypothetical protein n=1 Tax=Nonomuraea rubra TaxID=46180 RepID=UPI003613CD2A